MMLGVHIRSRLQVSAVALLAVIVSGTGAVADPAPEMAESGAHPGDENALQEVVVTAQKRNEQIKDVPISLSAVSGNDLQTAHIADYDDITRALPGVSFGSGASEGLTNIEIRGVSSTSGSATVGIYLDDVSVTVKNFYDGSTEPKLFDLDRIEVLRGPQGTLWGASSMGGTIRFITKQPDLDSFSGEVSADLSGTEHGGVNFGGTAIVNIPIEPGKFAIRAALTDSNDSGYIDRYANNYGMPGALLQSGVNDERATALRVTGLMIPDDGWKITPSVFFQRDQTADNSAFYPGLGLWEQDKEIDEYGRDTVFMPSLTVSKDLGFASLTSISGFFWREFSRQEDGTYYNSYAFANFFVDPLYSAPQYANQTAQVNKLIGNIASPIKYQTTYGQISQELRLASPPKDETGLPLTWQVGLYYADQYDKHVNYQRIPGVNTTFQQIFGYSMDSPQSLVEQTYGAPGLVLFPDDIDEDDHSHYDERQAAVFGQTDFDILPDLHGTVGLRYVYARADYNFQTLGFYQIGNISPYNQLDHYYALTPKFSVDYDIDPESSVYATASKGFRLGGPTGPLPFGPTTVCAGDEAAQGVTSQPTKFDSDKLWSYELGSKNRLDNDRLSIDGAIYYIDWQNIQQQIYLPTCGYYYTTNVGNAESYGSEIEIHYRALPGLTFGLTGSAEHAVITSTNNAQTVQVGEKVLNTPDWTATFSAEYHFPLTDEITGFARSDYSWVGRSRGSYVATNSNFSNPQYDVLNASIGVETASFSVSLYAKNLGDDKTIIQRPEINTVIEGYTVRPLTVGMTAKVPF
jgi:outer membrane receptor protein involved in Fe transport